LTPPKSMNPTSSGPPPPERHPCAERVVTAAAVSDAVPGGQEVRAATAVDDAVESGAVIETVAAVAEPDPKTRQSRTRREWTVDIGKHVGVELVDDAGGRSVEQVIGVDALHRAQAGRAAHARYKRRARPVRQSQEPWLSDRAQLDREVCLLPALRPVPQHSGLQARCRCRESRRCTGRRREQTGAEHAPDDATSTGRLHTRGCSSSHSDQLYGDASIHTVLATRWRRPRLSRIRRVTSVGTASSSEPNSASPSL
jgi:hypothetical protein